MEVLAHQLLLAAAALGLAGAGFRLASTLVPGGLARLVATAPLAVAAAVIWGLALGLAELGTSPVALAVAAVGTWVGARLAVPAPATPLADEAVAWWRGLSPAARGVAGALAAAVAGHGLFLLRHPYLGVDAVIYHLPDVVAWIGNGRPGSSVDLLYGLPVGNYPQATEAALTWGAAISRSFVFPGLWSLAMLVLLVASGWLGLRALGCGRRLTVLGLLALCTNPLLATAVSTPGTDLPALAWLATAAALVAVSPGRPGLLAPALVAAALGVGTKTTVAPLAVVVLVIAVVVHRGRLGAHSRALVLAGVAALVVGGTWYVRNLIGHGSPLWPLLAMPWGDEVPDLIARLDYSFLDRPADSLRGHVDRYERDLAGYLALFAAAVLMPLAVRRRAVAAAGAAAVLSVLIWMNAPFTGSGDVDALPRIHLTTVRYLMPAAAAAVLCLCLAGARGGRRGSRLAVAALAVAAGWNLLHTLDRGYPIFPSAASLAVAALAGAAVALVLSRVTPTLLASATAAPRAAALAALAAGVAVAAVATGGYVERHARAAEHGFVPFSEVVRALEAQPLFGESGDPVAMAPGVSAMFAGDTFDRDVVLIPIDEPCARVERRAREGWVVIHDVVADSIPPFTARLCFEGERPVYEAGGYRVYRLP